MSTFNSKETGQVMYQYSPVPREHYSVKIDGDLDGIGLHPAFNVGHPGVWNIFWLVSSTMDAFLQHSPILSDLPYTSSILPYVVGTAHQLLSNRNSVGELAAVSPPDVWWKTVQEDANFDKLLLTKFCDKVWMHHVEDRLVEYRKNNSAKILRVNFGVAA